MKKQEAIYFHKFNHNILGGLSMGLFGKSKKELELEKEAQAYQNSYGIGKEEIDLIKRSLRCRFSTDNIDLLLKLSAPNLSKIAGEIYNEINDNNQRLKRIESKYDELLDAVNKQNALLSQLVGTNTQAFHAHR